MKLSDILLYVSSLLFTGLFYSCAERDFDQLQGVRDEGTVTFHIGVPAPERVNAGTRSVSESGVNTLDVLVFYNTDGNGLMAQAPYHVDDWKEEGGLITFTMAISREFPDPSGLTYLVLANASADIISQAKVGETSVENYRTTLLDIEQVAGDYLLMTGLCTHGDLFDAHDHLHVVTMKRSVAAVSVTMAGETKGCEFKLFGMPSQLELAAGINDESNLKVSAADGYADASSYLDEDSGIRYVCPVRNDSKDDPENLSMNPTAVVKAKFDDVDYYYRLSFVNKKADGTTEALDVLPNHKYEFIIKGITGPGYASAEEAATGLHSTSVEYVINDTQATIFNMSSDGVRELGISNKIEDMLGDDLTVEFYVKCYPAPDSYNVLNLTADQDWITISASPVDTQTITEPDGQVAKLFTYEATLAINREGTLREGHITVAWDNLTANLKVEQDRSFIADRHTEVELMISSGSIYEHRIFNYWDFINGDGTDYDYGQYSYGGVNAPYLHGIKPEDNGGRVRNQGLHFPCNYGEYTYNIRPVFSDDIDVKYYTVSLRSGSKFKGKVYFDEGMQPIDNSLYVSYNESYDGNERYEPYYENDCLIITGYDSEGKKLSNLVMDIYHTGFFDWSDYSNNRSDRTYDNKYECGWFYYEVVPIILDGETTYWMDRNLGATASGFDILDHDGNSLFSGEEQFPFLGGTGKSRGGMYHSVMTPGNNYSEPWMNYDFGPSGFSIPSRGDFNELRNSSSFITTRSTTPNLVSYYNAYYQLSNGRRVYFPKVGHMQDGALASDANTGHYWTSTEATGVEKDELGKWLTTFVIGSGAESFSRARLFSPLYAMPVRMRNWSYQSNEYYQTFLKVQGATHVFLYRDVTVNGKTTREWVNSWPGTSVATPEIAFEKLHNFVYETTRDVKFKVLFNFVEASGKIVTMAASDSEKGAAANGWDAEGTFIFDVNHQRVE